MGISASMIKVNRFGEIENYLEAEKLVSYERRIELLVDGERACVEMLTGKKMITHPYAPNTPECIIRDSAIMLCELMISNMYVEGNRIKR